MRNQGNPPPPTPRHSVGAHEVHIRPHEGFQAVEPVLEHAARVHGRHGGGVVVRVVVGPRAGEQQH